jgi:cell division protein FtsQ
MVVAGLMGCSGLVYHVAFSPAYHLSNIHTSGNQLVSTSEVEAIVASAGTEALWFSPGIARARLLELPAIAEADVKVTLPDRVEVRVRERAPGAVLESGGSFNLLDPEGMIIGSVDTPPPLLTIRDLDEAPARPGDRIDPEAFNAIKVLDSHLHGTAFAPAAIRLSRQSGIELETREGLVVRVGDGKDLDWKLGALERMRDYLVEHRMRAQLIDIRFRDRPYFR